MCCLVLLAGCERRAEKVINASSEAHLEPFKTEIGKFLEEGE